MKIGQFAAITGTNNDIEDMTGFQEIAYHDGKYYWGVPNNPSEDYYVKSSTLTGSTSTEDTHAFSGGMRVYTHTKILYINSKWYLISVADGVDNTGFGARLVCSHKDLTTPGAWVNTTVTEAGADPDYVQYDIIDIISFANPIVYIIYYRTEFTGAAFTYTIQRASLDLGAGTLTNQAAFVTDTFDSRDSYYPGRLVDSYYYMVYGTAANRKLIYFDSAFSVTSDTLTGIDAPASWSRLVQLYWKQKELEILMDKDHLYTRFKGGSWKAESGSGTTTNAVIWDYNGSNDYILKYIVWKDSIYQVMYDQIIPIQPMTAAAYVGWSDWFANGSDTIYQITPTLTKGGTTIEPSNLKFDMLKASFTDDSAADVFQKDELVSVYSDDDVLYFKGLVVTSNKVSRVITLQNPAVLDLNLPITLTVATNLDTVLDDNLIYCTSTVTPTISIPICTNKPLGTILREDVTQGGYVWYVTPELDLQVNDGQTLHSMDYKAGVKGVVKWGTAGSPDLSAWPATNCTAVIEDKTTHKNTIHITATAANAQLDNIFTTVTNSIDEVWVYIPDTAVTSRFMVWRDGSTDAFYVKFTSGNVTAKDASGTTGTLTTYTAGWHHIHANWTKSSTLKIYLNGILIHTGTVGAHDIDRFVPFILSDTIEMWIDALGFSWDSYTPRSLLWTDSSGASCTVTRTDIGGRVNVLDLYDNNAADDCELVTTFTSVQTSGTLILYVRTGDATFGNEIQIRDSTNIKIRLIIDADQLQNDDGGGFDNLQAMSDDIWYQFKIIFDCGTDTFDLYIDGTLYTGLGFYAAATDLDNLLLSTYNGDSNYHMYVDITYLSWDTRFRGDNERMGCIGDFAQRVKPKTLPQTVGAVTVIYNNNEEVTAERGSVGGKPYVYRFPSITTSALATTKAELLLDDLNKSIFQLRFQCSIKGPFQVGHLVYLDIADEGDLEPKLLIYDQYYILKASYDEENDIATLIVQDARLIPRPRLTTAQVDTQVQQLQISTPMKESADPADPSSGKATMWVDSNGDLHIKINHGGTTKDITLVDWSAA